MVSKFSTVNTLLIDDDLRTPQATIPVNASYYYQGIIPKTPRGPSGTFSKSVGAAVPNSIFTVFGSFRFAGRMDGIRLTCHEHDEQKRRDVRIFAQKTEVHRKMAFHVSLLWVPQQRVQIIGHGFGGRSRTCGNR